MLKCCLYTTSKDTVLPYVLGLHLMIWDWVLYSLMCLVLPAQHRRRGENVLTKNMSGDIITGRVDEGYFVHSQMKSINTEETFEQHCLDGVACLASCSSSCVLQSCWDNSSKVNVLLSILF
jgi:hypothetical protein